MKLKHLILLAVGCSSNAFAVQTCYDELFETTAVANFTVLSNGLVQDKNTGLMWTRCAYGQTWDETNTTCTGTPAKVTWQNALQLSANLEMGGHSDWRLPNVKELASIVERKCVDPSVNATLFPNTASENYWTSTTVAADPSAAWAVAYYNGKNNTKDKLVDVHVRFVRYAE